MTESSEIPFIILLSTIADDKGDRYDIFRIPLSFNEEGQIAVQRF